MSGVEAEETEEKADDDSDVDPDYKDNYDHVDDWDLEELLAESEEEEEEEESNNNNKEEDDDKYTASECAYMNIINTLEDNDSIEGIEQEEEKDERYYLREKKAMKRVKVTNKLRLHIEEAQSLRQEVRKAVAQAKEDNYNNVPIAEMHIVAIVDFCQNIQLLFNKTI